MRYNIRMLGRISAFLREPRRPLAGVAVAALAGILLGEAGGSALRVGGGTLALVLSVFLGAVGRFCYRPRPSLCWAILIGGFATLHLFQSNAVPALVLARELTPGPGSRGPALCQAVGVILDEPRLSASTSPADAPVADWRFTFGLELIGAANPSMALPGAGRRRLEGCGPQAGAGKRLNVIGTAENVAPPRNPGEFDYAGYLRRRGIRSELTMQGIADVRPASGQAVFGPWMQRLHDWIDATLRLDLQDDPEVPRLVTTILLGLRDSPGLGDLEPIFQRTGTLHYFAIDGLKLGFLASLLLAALTRWDCGAVGAGVYACRCCSATRWPPGLGRQRAGGGGGGGIARRRMARPAGPRRQQPGRGRRGSACSSIRTSFSRWVSCSRSWWCCRS